MHVLIYLDRFGLRFDQRVIIMNKLLGLYISTRISGMKTVIYQAAKIIYKKQI